MIRVLLLTQLEPDYHDFPECTRLLQQGLEQRGDIRVTVTLDPSDLRPATLRRYDVVVVRRQGGKLTAAQQAALCDAVAKGKGFVGIHSASDSFVANRRYMEMIGSQFVTHGPVMEHHVTMTQPDHILAKRIGDFSLEDELYLLRERAKPWDVFATAMWKGSPQPVAYTRVFGAGRVFYLALGHDRRSVGHPVVQQLAGRGVRWAARVAPDEERTIGAGLVGYGPAFDMGRQHAKWIDATPGLRVVAACDRDPVRARAAAEELPDVKTYTSMKRMLRNDDVEVAVLVVPHNVHARLALQALEAGRHVACEKPFCITVEEATRMIRTARRRDRMLTVFHNRRWDTDFLAIRDILRAGTIGEVFHVEAAWGGYQRPRGDWWRDHKPICGGLNYDWSAHFFDWILSLMPGRIVNVNAFYHKRVWHHVTNEDQCQTILRFEGDRMAEFQISTIAAAPKPKWRILGTQGAVVMDNKETLKVTTHVGGRLSACEVPIPKIEWSNRFYPNIADHLLRGEPLAVTAEQARRVIAVIRAAEKAAKTGKPENVPFE